MARRSLRLRSFVPALLYGSAIYIASACTLLVDLPEATSGGGGGQMGCASDETDCDGSCANLNSDEEHCGACGASCEAGWVCADSVCRLCPGTQTVCAGECVQQNNNNLHCGACDASCAAGEVCGNGECALTCPPGQTLCTDTCVDVSSDEANCGTCGTTCGDGEECVDGGCAVTCTGQLVTAISDGWGNGWDGEERTAVDYQSAKADCEATPGARLPVVTELHRVRASAGIDAIASALHTQPLWSHIPFVGTAQHTVRLSDGAVSNDDITQVRAYRCTCAPEAPVFARAHCMGPGTSPCFALDAKRNIDAVDRPALAKHSAIAECAILHGHLASLQDLSSGVSNGLGGLGDVLAINEDTGLGAGLDPSGGALGDSSLVYGLPTTATAFRCVGANVVGTPPSGVVPNSFTVEDGAYIGLQDDMVAAPFITAHDACWATGGHLPTKTEVVELVNQGMPGSGTLGWTGSPSDQVEFTCSGIFNLSTVVGAVQWTEPPYDYAPSPQTVVQSSGLRPHRCVYFATDPTHVAPTDAECEGGCYGIAVGSGTLGIDATLWFDTTTRGSATWLAAAETCRELGGMLPRMRDLRSAIRNGLPNPGDRLWTADIQDFVQLVDLSPTNCDAGPASAFGPARLEHDASGTSAPSTSRLSSSASQYRCMWTNEIR